MSDAPTPERQATDPESVRRRAFLEGVARLSGRTGLAARITGLQAPEAAEHVRFDLGSGDPRA